MRTMHWCTPLLAASLTAFGTGSAMAQNGSLSFGPLVGVSLADFHGSDVGSTNSHTSFAAGVFATYTITPNVALEPQLFYVGKGTEVSAGGVTGTFKLDYIEVPVLFKATYPLRGETRVVPSAFAGPAVGFRTTCKIKASSGGTSVEQSCADAGVSIKSTDIAMVFGVGLEIGPIVLQGRYDLGLTKVDDTSPSADVKNQAWIITAGYRLPIGVR